MADSIEHAFNSRVLDWIRYCESTQQLEVRFCSGGLYSYTGVPLWRIRELVSAPSAGRYFLQNIAYSYRYAREQNVRVPIGPLSRGVPTSQKVESAHKTILLRLEVGKRNPLNIYKGKWNPNDEVGKIAMRIWDRLEYLRSLPYPFGSEHWIEAERAARRLREFDSETWPKWFDAAKAFILETHKTPEKIQQLNILVKAKTRRIPSYKIKSAPRISSHFFTMFKDKFRSMAGCNRD